MNFNDLQQWALSHPLSRADADVDERFFREDWKRSIRVGLTVNR